MPEREKLDIFYDILSGITSEKENSDFLELMKLEENQKLYAQIKKIWEEAANVRHYKIYDTRRAFYDLTRKIDDKKRIGKGKLIYALCGIAAGMILMFGLYGVMSRVRPQLKPGTVVFETETGNRSVLVLPDSSRVWLNSRTRLSYNTNFGKTNRDVTLCGEGFFEIKPDNQPFNVNIGDFQIKVYGTKFNVSAYSDDPEIVTCLETGKIRLQQKGIRELYVKPGQMVAYYKQTSVFRTDVVNTNEFSAWRINKMYMHNESLRNLVRKLERKYNVTVTYFPDDLGEKVHYSGVFGNENIEEVLNAISIASGLKYSKNGNLFKIVNK